MPLNQQALQTLTPQQQQVVQQAIGISKQQRQQRGFMDEWQAYKAAVAGLAGSGATTTQPSTTTVTAPTVPGSTGLVAGNPRALFKAFGGRSGSGMGFAEFRKWYERETNRIGMDLSQYMQMAGLSAANITGGDKAWSAATGPGATSIFAGSEVGDVRNLSPGRLSDEAELFWMNKLGGTNYGSLDEAKNAQALASGFAGIEQWRYNLAHPGADEKDYPLGLLNASMQDIRYEPRAWELLFGALRDAKDPKALMEARQAMVPDWAADVDKALRESLDITHDDRKGIPFGFELLADPEVNLTDPSKPLFSGQANPLSLMPLTGLQSGEGNVLRSASAAEVMQHLWPLVYAQHHRQAGKPAPFEAGLTFGSPVLGANARYTRSPVMGFNDEMNLDPDAMRIWGIEPGKAYGPGDLPGLYQRLAGGIYNRYQAQSQWQDRGNWGDQLSGLDPRMRDDILKRWLESYWTLPEYAPFQNLPPDVMARLMAVLQNPMQPGTETALTNPGQGLYG